MIREASAMYQIPMRIEAPTQEDAIKSEILQWLTPVNPDSLSFEYLSRFDNRYESFLEQLAFTVLVRYADYLSYADTTHNIGLSLENILSHTDWPINDLTHHLIALIYPDEHPEDHQNEITPLGEHLDISEFEAEIVYRSTLSKINRVNHRAYPFANFISFSGINSTNLPPVDTVITATMIQFAIDLAIDEDGPNIHMPDVRRTLAPLFIHDLDTDYILPRMRQISQFVGERIQYL